MAKKSSILLNLVNFSAKKITDLIVNFPDLDLILKVGSSDLRKVSSLTSSDIEKILSFRHDKTLEKELELIEKNKIVCLDIFDADYPVLLKEIDSAPLVIYIKGNPKVLNKVLFAIVGSRKATAYGISKAKQYSLRLSSLGIGIVSGLALGIDAAAHQAAIVNGQTVAVLGNGLLKIYPKENSALAERIVESGAIISEFPLKAPPLPENFPRRNRIISGLAQGVLVVEAAVKSGARITARLAVEQNREVFAIPGPVDSLLSKGSHLLIKEGAKLVDCLEDILEELNISFDPAQGKEESLVS